MLVAELSRQARVKGLDDGRYVHAARIGFVKPRQYRVLFGPSPLAEIFAHTQNRRLQLL